MRFDDQFLSLLIFSKAGTSGREKASTVCNKPHKTKSDTCSFKPESEFLAKWRRQYTKEISENITRNSIKCEMHHKKLKELVWFGETTIELCRSCFCFSALTCICYCRLIASIWERNSPGSLFHFRNHRCCCTHSVYNLRGEWETKPNQKKKKPGSALPTFPSWSFLHTQTHNSMLISTKFHCLCGMPTLC